jgi:hypothetical protein
LCRPEGICDGLLGEPELSPLANLGNVRLREFRHRVLLSADVGSATCAVHIRNIVLVRSDCEMLGIHTRTDIAEMADDETLWD